MLTLCIDTAYKYLTCALIQDDTIIASDSFLCFKKQSEELLGTIKRMFKQANINSRQIDSICISEGPGSYTGVRIAMTLAKTIGQTLPCDVYTISTLRLYAAGKPKVMVIMNARASRAYVGVYDKNEIVLNDYIANVNEINPMDYTIIGDASLINREDNYPNIVEAFLATKPVWNKVNNIAYLVPKYLKESEDYLK